MLTPKLQTLAQYRARLAKLEKKLSAERSRVLSGLHSDLGYDTRAELIDALGGLGGGGGGGGGKGRGRGPGKKRRRAKITPEIRDQIAAAARDGLKGHEIATKFGVSLPTVQNIKRDAGLTKKRGKKKKAKS